MKLGDRKPMVDRILDRCIPEPNSGCWLWTGGCYPNGYSNFGNYNGIWTSGHRVSYQLFVGEIPDGLEIDHICRVISCVNPSHLRLVTHRENLLSGNTVTARRAAVTHCPAGDEYSEQNTYRDKKNRRYCRICCNRRSKEYQQRKRQNAVM
jgi:hypothetical protein